MIDQDLHAIMGDGSDIDVNDNAWLVPDGTYVMTVRRCELRDTKDGSGKIISFMFKSDSREVLWHNFAVIHRNEAVERIAKHRLKLVSRSLGFDSVPDNCEPFIGRQCQLIVKKNELMASLAIPSREIDLTKT